MLHVILLDSAIELIPSEISSSKQIQRHAGKRGKKPTDMLLDQTHHGRVMTKLENSERRGRPDIAYHCLLSLLETPLCKEGLLTVNVHLQDGRIVEVNPSVRLPRNYDRFVGLIEQLLKEGRVPSDGEPLLRISNNTLQELFSSLRGAADRGVSILCTLGGERTSVDELGKILPIDSSVPVMIGVGAFPHGDLSQETKDEFETHVELDKDMMMAWHICAEVIWMYSWRVGVVKSRYAQTSHPEDN
ncbi:MAG: 16S rRNA methyltransferase [Promethearchaeota archaeon]